MHIKLLDSTYLYLHKISDIQHLTQTYFPNFLESAIYLRFLNELIHTLKISGGSSTCTDSEIEAESDDGPGGAVADLLEDPSSIWQRPIFKYVKLQACMHEVNQHDLCSCIKLASMYSPSGTC